MCRGPRMLTVHHLNNSRSQRVLWLLEELGVPYQIELYQRDKDTMLAPPELKRIHPLGKSPVVTDGDVTIAESAVIIEYLVGRYGEGRLVPAPGTPEALQYRYFMHYAEGSAMPPLLLKLVFSRMAKPMPWFIRPVGQKIASTVQQRFIDPQLTTHLGFLEQHLKNNTWFAGSQFTAVDVQMSFPMEAFAARGPSGLAVPHVKAFVGRVRARPAYQEALRKGGPLILG
jgi:glutathione S-transferase